MQRTIAYLSLVAALTLGTPIDAKASNGSYTYAGGAFSTGTAVGQNISVLNAPLSATSATVSFSCPITSYGAGTYQINWTCTGGTISISSADSSLVFQGSFLSGSMQFSGGGGGRGGHTTYYYQFSGSFSGTVSVAGTSQAVYGSMSQAVKTTAQIGTGSAPVTAASFGWNSAYSPVVVGDAVNGRLLSADNITGTNISYFGSPGTGTDNFGVIAGLAVDATGRIYATDSSLDRLIRIDNMSGKNWVSLGGSGTGTNQFTQPAGVTIDATGKIWVADSGNNRIVRFDDLTGKNWTTFGSLGVGVNQFSSPSAVAVDAQGRIYVTDAGNNRLVRFDDLTGKNWTTLTQLNIDPYGYPVAGPTGIVMNASGRIFVTLTNGYLLGMDDITGTNPSVSYWGGALSGISLDRAGTFYVIGAFTPPLAQAVDGSGTGYFASTLGMSGLQPSAVVARPVGSTVAEPALSARSLSFGSQNVGEPGPAQKVTLTNLASGPLTISSIAASADFPVSSNCVSPLTGGNSCTISVQFDPTTTGTRKSTLTVLSNGVHSTLSVSLSGQGLVPGATVFPGALTFDAQLTGTSSTAQTVTVANPGSGPLTISSIATSGDFIQTSNCPKVLTAGNGCTLQVTFKPTTTGTRLGSLTTSDDAVPSGAQQTVSLQGTGTSTAAAFTVSPESLFFPDQKIATTSRAQAVTLTNHSGTMASLTVASYSAGFKGSTTCGSTLANGSSCVYSVEFKPAAVGPASGTLTIPITRKPSLTVGLSGTGVAGTQSILRINPSAINFGAEVIGDQYVLSVTVSNPTGVPAGIQSISLSAPPQLKITGNNCPAILAGGASCKISVTFIPASTPAYYNGTLTFVESAGTTTLIPVSGEGVTDSGGGN